MRPGQAFLDWLYAADPASAELTFENLQREPTVYLLPDCENEEEVRERLKKFCGQIFEEQPDGWYRVPSTWPTERELANLDHWFEWTIHSVIVDLRDDPLLQREI